MNSQRPSSVTWNEPTKRSFPSKRIGASCHCRRARAGGRGRPRRAPRARPGRSSPRPRPRRRASASRDSGRSRSRARRPRSGYGVVCSGVETSRTVSFQASTSLKPYADSTIKRRPAARLLAPGRQARPGGVSLRRLARLRRPVVVGAPAPRPAGLGGLAVRQLVRIRRPRRLSREARSARHDRRARGLRREGALLGRGLGGLRRATGAIADQVRFDREWSALRRYAAERGVSLFGDVPIYVARDGADEAAHPELFQHGLVAGAPPDALSALGQLWGNPLYDWGAIRAQGYRWWIERLRRTFELYDAARIDHFRGFVSYWAVPEGHKTAKRGHWVRGPGAELFDDGRARARAAQSGRRGPRRDHEAGRRPARQARDAGHGRDAVRLRRAVVQPAPHPEPPAAKRRLRRDARLRHRARLVAHAPEADQGRRPASPASSRTGS